MLFVSILTALFVFPACLTCLFWFKCIDGNLFFVASHVCSERTGKREKGNINISITMSLSKSTGNKWKNPLQHRRPSWPPVPGLFLKTCSRSFVGRGQSDRTDISRGANSCTRSCVDSYLGYHLQAAQNNRKNENNMEIVENSSPFFALVLFLPWLIEHNLQEGQAAATSGIWRIFFYFGSDKKDDLFPSHRNTQPPRLTVVH